MLVPPACLPACPSSSAATQSSATSRVATTAGGMAQILTYREDDKAKDGERWLTGSSSALLQIRAHVKGHAEYRALESMVVQGGRERQAVIGALAAHALS